MSEAPYLEDVKQAVDEYRGEMSYYDVEIETSFYFEEKEGWSGVKLVTEHDGVYQLLKILREYNFVPTQINNAEDGEGLKIYIDLFENVGGKVY